MKKLRNIILSMLVLVTLGSLQAQDKAVRFGVKAGLNVSTVYGDLEYDPTAGFYIGGLADFTVSKKIHIQPELLYSLEGFKDASIGYLRLPIMAKYYTSNRFNLQLGPTIGLKANADDLINDAITSFDVGVALGCEYEFPKGLSLSFRYNVGLNNINDVSGGFEFRNSALQLGLGYRF
jgi:hypothetical protein